MTENPDDIRDEIEIAHHAYFESTTEGTEADVARAVAEAHGRHLYRLHLRLARAGADPTNKAQAKR